MSIRGGLFNHYGGPHKVIFYKKKKLGATAHDPWTITHEKL